jgi:hypothetical protein
MKKTVIPSLLMIFALGACTTERIVEVEKTTPTTAYVAPSPSPMDAEQNFLNGLTYDHPTEVSRLGKASVLELGRLTCEAIDEGSTVSDFVGMASKTGASPEFIGSLIREAVENFCPENQWFIDSALNSNGI